MIPIEYFGIIPVEFGAIAEIIGDYKAPRDKISKLEKTGSVIRLKKGLFVISPDLSKEKLSTELIANHLLGPSYISMESALSYYGLIPERVYTIRSATIKRSKSFTTPISTFEYLTVPECYFPIGIKNEIIDNSFAFLIGSPEKALCDLILTTANLRIQSKKAMETYLHKDLRIDFSQEPTWDLEIIEKCIERGRKKNELKILYETLKS